MGEPSSVTKKGEGVCRCRSGSAVGRQPPDGAGVGGPLGNDHPDALLFSIGFGVQEKKLDPLARERDVLGEKAHLGARSVGRGEFADPKKTEEGFKAAGREQGRLIRWGEDCLCVNCVKGFKGNGGPGGRDCSAFRRGGSDQG